MTLTKKDFTYLRGEGIWIWNGTETVLNEILENQEYREMFEHHLSRQFLEDRFEYDSIGKGQFAKLREENKHLKEKLEKAKDRDYDQFFCIDTLRKENKQLKELLEAKED